MARKDILEVETRRNVYRIIRDHPGIHLRELARQAEISFTLCDYHVQALQRHGLVTELKEGGYLMYFPAPTEERQPLSEQEKRILAFLRRRVPGRIIAALADGPLRHNEILARLDITKSTLTYHLKRLADAGVVRSLEGGRYALAQPRLVARLVYVYARRSLVDSFSDSWEEFYRKDPQRAGTTANGEEAGRGRSGGDRP